MAAKKASSSKAAPPKRAARSAGETDALLQRILRDPRDLESRLIYADRAMEADDPRGTFIAHQCALDTMDSLDPRYAPLLASTRRLQAAHGRTWLAHDSKRTKIDAGDRRVPIDSLFNAVFERGFLRRVTMRPEDIEEEWPRLREREPVEGIELLVGEHLDVAYRGLTAPKEFRLLKVSPESWFTSNSVANVLAWGMPHLRELDLSRCDLGPTGAELLSNLDTTLGLHFADFVKPPPFADGQLTQLALKNTNIADAGATMLFSAKHLTALESLDIAQCKIERAPTLTALRNAPALTGLKRLTLSGNNGLGGHLNLLAGWEALPRLVQLALPQTTTTAALTALFPKPSTHLRELDLSMAKELVKSPDALLACAEALTYLDIGGTSLGDDLWSVVLASPAMQRVIHLFANGCSLSDDAIHALTKSKLKSLVTIDLSSNKLTDKALAELAAWSGLEHVTHLRLGNNRRLTSDGYRPLIESKIFQPAAFDIGKSTDGALKSRLKARFGDVVISS